MTKLTITRGYPASGKTTWALWESKRTGASVVSRDDIREDVFGLDNKGVLNRDQEDEVTRLQTSLVVATLRAGRDVIVADTNLRMTYVNKWRDVAAEIGVDFEINDFKVDAEECIERDALRAIGGEKSVGADVIRKMAKHAPISKWKNPAPSYYGAVEITKYVPNLSLDDAYIFDVDGTLADCTGIRNPYDAEKALDDKPIGGVIDILFELEDHGYAIVILTGRKAEHREITEQWLVKHGIPWDDLWTRADGDDRPDWIVKQELFDQHVATKYNVMGVFDDRLQVAKMWYKKGLTLFRVSDPTADF